MSVARAGAPSSWARTFRPSFSLLTPIPATLSFRFIPSPLSSFFSIHPRGWNSSSGRRSPSPPVHFLSPTSTKLCPTVHCPTECKFQSDGDHPLTLVRLQSGKWKKFKFFLRSHAIFFPPRKGELLRLVRKIEEEKSFDFNIFLSSPSFSTPLSPFLLSSSSSS